MALFPPIRKKFPTPTELMLAEIRDQLPPAVLLPNDAYGFSTEVPLLVSVGHLPCSRALILCDFDDPDLHGLIDLSHIEYDACFLLDRIFKLSLKLFPNDHYDEIAAFEQQYDKRRITLQDSTLAAIPLKEFIAQGMGVCRHHALLHLFLVELAIREGKLSGNAFYVRLNSGEKKTVSHAYVIFLQEDGALYLLDIKLKQLLEANDVLLHERQDELIEVCGEALYERSVVYYAKQLDLSLAPTQPLSLDSTSFG